MNKRKEVPVRNNPGIYKEYKFCQEKNKWIETGKFRSIRRIVKDGRSAKEQGSFSNIEQAKAFRAGQLENSVLKQDVHKNTIEATNQGTSFEGLVEDWKKFHFLQIEPSTKQTYEKRLPNLSFLNRLPVEQITTSLVDSLVQFWVNKLPKGKQRENFEKELNLLKVILGYYRKRRNPAYIIPVLDEHYRAADIAKKSVKPVQALNSEQLAKFLAFLKKGINPQYHVLALAQFCLGLRIGEACGLNWQALDLERKEAIIEQTITWDHDTWQPMIKNRPKNGKVRVLVLPDLLVEELKRVKVKRDPNVELVFHRKGTPLSRKDVGKVYNRALKALGISHVSGTHMLRKTAATLANEATGDFYAVSKLLDHSTPDVTLRYVSQTGIQKKKIASALDGLLRQAIIDEKDKAIQAAELPKLKVDSRPVPQCPASSNRHGLMLIKSAI
jgi:integrase